MLTHVTLTEGLSGALSGDVRPINISGLLSLMTADAANFQSNAATPYPFAPMGRDRDKQLNI